MTNHAVTAAVSAKLAQRPSASSESDSGWPSAYRSGSAKRIASPKLAMTSTVPTSGDAQRQQKRDQDDVQQVEQRERVRGSAGEKEERRERGEIEAEMGGDLAMRGRRTAPRRTAATEFIATSAREDERHGTSGSETSSGNARAIASAWPAIARQRRHISCRRLEISAGGSAAAVSVAAGAARGIRGRGTAQAGAVASEASVRNSVMAGWRGATERRALILARRGPLLR